MTIEMSKYLLNKPQMLEDNIAYVLMNGAKDKSTFRPIGGGKIMFAFLYHQEHCAIKYENQDANYKWRK